MNIIVIILSIVLDTLDDKLSAASAIVVLTNPESLIVTANQS